MDISKTDKENFVTGLNGTTMMEINLIVHYPMILSSLRVVVLATLPLFMRKSRLLRFLLDYILLIIPIIGITTVMADNIDAIFATTLLISICGTLVLPSKKEQTYHSRRHHAVNVRRSASKELLKDGFDLTLNESHVIDKNDGIHDSLLDSCIMSQNRVPGITLFRSWVTIVSCVCILAVDFHIFPRRFAKTEVYGTGLMDTGVGLFIVSNAVVSPEARSKFYNKVGIFGKLSFIKGTCVATWPLWLIGMMRLISVKMIGYQEHVSEYGVHWNFFFTLATVRILSSFLTAITSKSFCLVLSIFCVIFYQFMLLYPVYDLTAILFNDDRHGFFMANKEGICSCLGYLSLYFAAVHLGSFLFKPRHPCLRVWIKVIMKLFFMSAFSWLVTHFANNMIQPISRRFANLAYVAWVMSMSYSLIAMSILMIVSIIACSHYKDIAPALVPDKCLLQNEKSVDVNAIDYDPPPPTLCLVTAVNQNQLLYFLLSNLCTGIVNVCFDTLRAPDTSAFSIISLYMLVTLSVIWILHMKQSKLKCW